MRIEEAFRRAIRAQEPAPRTLEDERTIRTLSPTLIIGLGGAGCGIAVRLKLALQRYYRDMPDLLTMIQFLVLDTEDFHRHSDRKVSQYFINGSEYVFLGGFNPRNWVYHHLEQDSLLRQWWPQDTGLAANYTITAGCRRIRALGRLCLYRAQNNVRTAVSNAIRRAVAVDEQAVQDGKLPPFGGGASLQVHVISGSCGGTGSGMLLDFLTIIRQELENNTQSDSQLSAVVVMPTFYRSLGQNVNPTLMRARGANGYAFLRELQHFYHHPEQWPQHSVVGVAGGGAVVPAETCYLMDDEIAERVLPDLDSIYDLTADAILQKLVSPVAAREVDNNEHNVALDRDRTRAFSSMGLSYVVYPRKTIARCAGASFLRDLLDLRLQPGLTEEEAKAGRAAADNLFRNYAHYFNAEEVARQLASAANPLAGQLPTDASVLEDARRPDATKPRLAQAMQKAERKSNTVRDQALDAMRAASRAHIEKTRTALLAELEQECVSMICDKSVEYALSVVRRLTELVQGISPSAPVGPERGSSISSDIEQSVDYVTQVTKLEQNWVPDSWERRKFAPLVTKFVRRLTDRFAAEVAENSAKIARQYVRETVLPVLREIEQRLPLLMERLTVLRNELDAVANDLSADTDEYSTPITTQYLPTGGIPAAVKQCLDSFEATKTSLARSLFDHLSADRVLWSLGSQDASGSVTRVADKAVEWVCQQPKLSAIVRRNLADVIEQDVGADRFLHEVLPNAFTLADPTWRVDRNRVGADLEQDRNTLSNWPKGFPRELLDANQLGPQAANEGTLEPHKMLILRLEHGLPLHCLAGMSALKEDYNCHLRSSRGRKEPPHLCQDWARNPDLLEDILPAAREALDESFALGAFTDWLVCTRKLPDATNLIRQWEHGIIYERTPNQYYLAVLVAQGNVLRVREERQLGAGRNRAAESFTHDDAAQVNAFMERLTNAIGADKVCDLVVQYCDDFLAPRVNPHANHAERLKAQWRRELECLRRYAGQQ